MTRNRLAPLFGALLLAGLSGLAIAEDAAVQDPAPVELGPELRALLILEMLEIESATSDLPSALARGRWDRVAELGDGIEASFVLKQRLTPELRAEIGRLPEGFRAQDRSFHATGGELAAAARERDAEKALDAYSRLVSACVDCHGTYVPDRFPGLD